MGCQCYCKRFLSEGMDGCYGNAPRGRRMCTYCFQEMCLGESDIHFADTERHSTE